METVGWRHLIDYRTGNIYALAYARESLCIVLVDEIRSEVLICTGICSGNENKIEVLSTYLYIPCFLGNIIN